jgi:hypothetical protein
VLAVTALALYALYASDFALLQKPFLAAFMGYVALVFVIGSVLLKSFRWGFEATLSALVAVALLAGIHTLSFPAYDPVAPLAYFAVLLLSFLVNLYLLYGRFVRKQPLFQVYERSRLAITFVVVSTMLVGLILASQELLEQFGLLAMVGSALAYLVMLFYLAPLARLEGHFEGVGQLSDEEERVRNFIFRYGKDRSLHPFYASWLGAAVYRVEDYIDRLEAKGYLGHNFFSVHNFLMWTFTTISFLLGVASARGQLAISVVPLVLLLGGVVLLAPQAFMRRRTRRLSGILVLVAAFIVLKLWSSVALKFGAYSALLALVSIYFAYTDDETVSMVFAAFFTGSLYVTGYSLWKVPVVLSPEPWIITFAVFLLLVYEYYTQSE